MEIPLFLYFRQVLSTKLLKFTINKDIMLYSKTELKNGLFFKIGTSLQYENFSDLPEPMRNAWIEKYHARYEQATRDYCNAHDNIYQNDNETFMDTVYRIYAKYQPEYTKINDIAIGVISQKDMKAPLEIHFVQTVMNDDEKKLLEDIVILFEKESSRTIAGWNIGNYQIPFLIKRMLINGVKIPFLLQLKNKKPWDINMIDVMRDYQGNMFGDIDLSLVANQFKINDPMLNIGDELRITMDIAIKMCAK